MNRNLFLKILFRKILKFSVYLFALLLLLSSVYPAIAYKAGDNTAILILGVALLLAGLIYYLANRQVPKEELNKNAPLVAQDLLQLLKKRLDKEKLKPEMESLLNKYKKEPALFLLRHDLIYCHMRLLTPGGSHDYRFKDKVYTFDEGISYYIGKLETMLLTGQFVFNKNESIYELYLRRLFYKGDYVEVERIDSCDAYVLYKDVSYDDYYFEVEFGSGISLSYETRKVSDERLKATLKTAIQKKDKPAIRHISQILKEVQ